MGACLSCQQVQLQPGKVHSKKIKEIFTAYLKNQGIRITKVNGKEDGGAQTIDGTIVKNVNSHVKMVAKDLIQLMQIDQQFIKKICFVLTKRILDFDQSTELQYLGLVLLKEIIKTPLHEREKREQNIVKKQFQKFGQNVKKLRNIQKSFADMAGPRSSSTGPPERQPALAYGSTTINEADGLADQSPIINSSYVVRHQSGFSGSIGSAAQLGSSKKSKLQNSNSKSVSKSVKYTETAGAPAQGLERIQLQMLAERRRINLQDLQSKEFVFCVQNEQTILSTLNEIICYYNYDIAPEKGALDSKHDGSQSPRRMSFTAGSADVQTNRHYFATVCLDIINLLLTNIQKTQLADNEETYLDLISNFLFRSDENGVYGLFSLDPGMPIAEGLEPVPGGIGVPKVRVQDDIKQKIPIHFNFNYLHNNSSQKLDNLSDRQKAQNEAAQNLKRHLDRQAGVFSSEVRGLAYEAFFKVIRLMHESYFTVQFPQLLEYIWCLLIRSKDKIEMLGSAPSLVGTNKNSSQELQELQISSVEHQVSRESKISAMKEPKVPDSSFDQVVQIGFDLFQYVCVKIASDSIVDSEDQFNFMLHGILQYFNKKEEWRSVKFAEFVLILMIFNGGKTRIEGQIDFADFYVLLQTYYDSKMGHRQLNHPLESNLMDESLYDTLVENLFRLLMSDLFSKVEGDASTDPNAAKTVALPASSSFLRKKMNLVSVLFEMISLVDPKSQDLHSQLAADNINIDPVANFNENPAFKKMLNDSSLYIQIFGDLARFISKQSFNEESSDPLLAEQLFEKVLQMFELYLLKTQQQSSDILVKALDYQMATIQTLNQEQVQLLAVGSDLQRVSPNDGALKVISRDILQNSLQQKYLMRFTQVVVYFLNENLTTMVHSQNEEASEYQQTSQLRKKMTFKGKGFKGVRDQSNAQLLHQNSTTFQQRKTLARLKGDYMVYLLQTVTLFFSTKMEEYFTTGEINCSEAIQAARGSLKEDFAIRCLNLDLKIKQINTLIQHFRRQKASKEEMNVLTSSSVAHSGFHDLLSSLVKSHLHNKPIMHYKLKVQGLEEADSEDNGRRKYSGNYADDPRTSSFDQLLSSLLSHQMNEVKYRDFLQLYLFQTERFITNCLLRHSLHQYEDDQEGVSRLEHSTLILILENWCTMIQNSPKKRPDIGAVSFLAFLFQLMDSIQATSGHQITVPKVYTQRQTDDSQVTLINRSNTLHPDDKPRREKNLSFHSHSLQIDGGEVNRSSVGAVKPQKYILELQIKVRTLVIFMMYALLTQGESGESEGTFEFVKMKECLYQIYDKIQSSASTSQLSSYLPSFSPFFFLPDEATRAAKKKEQIDISVDSAELLSHKFERMLQQDIRDLDKMMSSQFYSLLNNEKPKLKQAALQDLNQQRWKETTQPFPAMSQDDVSIEKTITEFFRSDQLESEEVPLLGYHLQKAIEGNIIFSSIAQFNNETIQNISLTEIGLEKKDSGNPEKIAAKQMEKVSMINLNKKFDIQNFDYMKRKNKPSTNSGFGTPKQANLPGTTSLDHLADSNLDFELSLQGSAIRQGEFGVNEVEDSVVSFTHGESGPFKKERPLPFDPKDPIATSPTPEILESSPDAVSKKQINAMPVKKNGVLKASEISKQLPESSFFYSNQKKQDHQDIYLLDSSIPKDDSEMFRIESCSSLSLKSGAMGKNKGEKYF